MPFLSSDSPYASPVAYYPVHVPAARKAARKADRSVAPRKAQASLASARRTASAACAHDAPHCAHALARAAGKVQGCDYAPGVTEELKAMPEGLAFAIQCWTAARTRHLWIDANGMRHTAPSDPYSDLASAMPRKVWQLVNGKPAKAKPLSGTHGMARRRSNWTHDGIVSVEVLLRGVLSNLRRQESRNGGEAFKVETDASTKAPRIRPERDRRTVAKHRISLREQRLALRASVSPTLLPTLLASMVDDGPLSGSTRNILCAVRKRALELATVPATMAD